MKGSRNWHTEFIKYTEDIVKNPQYFGLYFTRTSENRIKWVVAGKSKDGNSRIEWWNKKCKEHNIKIEAGCYAKIARLIHPTKFHVCQICGRKLSIEYVYPNKLTLAKINKLLKINVEPYTLTIYEIINNFTRSNPEAIALIKQAFNITSEDISETELGEYIFKNCSTRLSPGVMSNCPDRFDGYHSDGNCCRGISDKGRHKENLTRYTEDRRAYENWSDGDWKKANRLMAEFNKNGVSADHIGPISLGFCHRAKFNPMTKKENSAKNNRMSLQDIVVLIEDEERGEKVISWHSIYIWNLLKKRVSTDEEAKHLSKLMRLNMHYILSTLAEIHKHKFDKFLITLLNPEYSFFDHKFHGFDVKTGSFKSVTSTEKHSKNQQNNYNRYIDISLESLEEYLNKKNRKLYNVKQLQKNINLNRVFNKINENDFTNAKLELCKIFEAIAEKIAQQWDS